MGRNGGLRENGDNVGDAAADGTEREVSTRVHSTLSMSLGTACAWLYY